MSWGLWVLFGFWCLAGLSVILVILFDRHPMTEEEKRYIASLPSNGPAPGRGPQGYW